MFFQVLGSSSSGNCSYLECDGVKAFIDAGLGIKRIRKYLAGRGLDIEDIDAVFVTHEHFDHCYTDGVKCRKIIRNSEDGFVVIDSYHDHNLGALRGKNRIFLKRSGMGNRGTFSGTGESQWKKLGLQHSGRTFCEGRSEADSA